MGAQDEYNEAWEAGRDDERERCARLVEMRGDIARVSAESFRKTGTYTARALWPPFKKVTYVAPKWERQAGYFDTVAHAFDIVALAIRAGNWDPRDPGHKLDEKICYPETCGVDGDPTTPYCRKCYRGPCTKVEL